LVQPSSLATEEAILETDFLGEIDIKAVRVDKFQIHDPLKIGLEVIYDISEHGL
jgi:hypothetical protein